MVRTDKWEIIAVVNVSEIVERILQDERFRKMIEQSEKSSKAKQ